MLFPTWNITPARNSKITKTARQLGQVVLVLDPLSWLLSMFVTYWMVGELSESFFAGILTIGTIYYYEVN